MPSINELFDMNDGQFLIMVKILVYLGHTTSSYYSFFRKIYRNYLVVMSYFYVEELTRLDSRMSRFSESQGAPAAKLAFTTSFNPFCHQ